MYGNQGLTILKADMNTDVPQLNYKFFVRKTKKTVQVKRRQGSSFEGKNILFNVLPVYFSPGHHTYTVQVCRKVWLMVPCSITRIN